MNVFVAGASGAIGRPLLAELVRHGHAVTGMTNSDAGARAVAGLGAAVARVSAFDAPALERALRESRAEVVIDELTALPRHPSGMAAAAAGDRKLRLEGGGNLHRAARTCGVRRYVLHPARVGAHLRAAAFGRIQSRPRTRPAPEWSPLAEACRGWSTWLLPSGKFRLKQPCRSHAHASFHSVDGRARTERCLGGAGP
jgi:nucleoside-diphosphate-sugar epimerase